MRAEGLPNDVRRCRAANSAFPAGPSPAIRPRETLRSDDRESGERQAPAWPDGGAPAPPRASNPDPSSACERKVSRTTCGVVEEPTRHSWPGRALRSGRVKRCVPTIAKAGSARLQPGRTAGLQPRPARRTRIPHRHASGRSVDRPSAMQRSADVVAMVGFASSATTQPESDPIDLALVAGAIESRIASDGRVGGPVSCDETFESDPELWCLLALRRIAPTGAEHAARLPRGRSTQPWKLPTRACLPPGRAIARSSRGDLPACVALPTRAHPRCLHSSERRS